MSHRDYFYLKEHKTSLFFLFLSSHRSHMISAFFLFLSSFLPLLLLAICHAPLPLPCPLIPFPFPSLFSHLYHHCFALLCFASLCFALLCFACVRPSPIAHPARLLCYEIFLAEAKNFPRLFFSPSQSSLFC